MEFWIDLFLFEDKFGQNEMLRVMCNTEDIVVNKKIS